MTFKLTLEYDGSRYSGWQEQRNARTVQGELREAAEKILRVDLEIQGAGRTDAGVHALGQVAHLRASTGRMPPPGAFRAALNAELPADIAVLSVDRAEDQFHARHDALTRTYVYRISTRKNAFLKRTIWWVKESLNLPLMSRAARMIEGRHDFVCFRAEDTSRPGESTQVVVESSLIELSQSEDMILFRIEASHFLWRMVRRLAGALVKLGKHEIEEDDFARLLSGRPDAELDVAAWTAPASGLFLESVQYPKWRQKGSSSRRNS